MILDITDFVIAVIGILGGIGLKYALPLVQAHTGAKTLTNLAKLAEIAVKAARELELCGDLEQLGQSKAEYAVNRVKTALAAKNIVFDEDTIQAAIKAAVTELRGSIENTAAAK